MRNLKINLIPGEERAGFEVILLLRKTKSIATFFVIFFILILFFTIFLVLRLNSQLDELSSKITNTEAKIKSSQSKEEYLVILKNRSNLVSRVINERKGINQALASIIGILPPGTNLEIIDSGGRGGLRITASSANLVSLNELYKNISQPDFTKNLNTLTISSISRSKGGSYNFFIDIAKN